MPTPAKARPNGDRQFHDRLIPLCAEKIFTDQETGDVEKIVTVLTSSGHTSKNKIRYGSMGDRDAFLNLIYFKKGVFVDRLLEGLRITIEPIYDKEKCYP